MQSLREFFRRGDPAVWFAGSGLGICLLMITGMIAIILVNGLGFFWPGPLVQVTLKDGDIALGEIVNRERVPNTKPGDDQHRIQMKVGNRDVSGVYFRWIDESEITKREEPADAIYVERREYGPFIGRVTALKRDDAVIAKDGQAWTELQTLMVKGEEDRAALRSQFGQPRFAERFGAGGHLRHRLCLNRAARRQPDARDAEREHHHPAEPSTLPTRLTPPDRPQDD